MRVGCVSLFSHSEISVQESRNVGIDFLSECSRMRIKVSLSYVCKHTTLSVKIQHINRHVIVRANALSPYTGAILSLECNGDEHKVYREYNSVQGVVPTERIVCFCSQLR